MQVLPLYWPYEKSLQSAVLQSLQSAEHGLGRDEFRGHNLRVTNQTESDGHVTVSYTSPLCRMRAATPQGLSQYCFTTGCVCPGDHRGWHSGVQASGGPSRITNCQILHEQDERNEELVLLAVPALFHANGNMRSCWK